MSGVEIAKIMDNTPICEHLKKNWKTYTQLADKCAEFGRDNEGQPWLTKSVLKIIESAVEEKASQTNFIDPLQNSGLPESELISLIARTVFESPRSCSSVTSKLIKKCAP